MNPLNSKIRTAIIGYGGSGKLSHADTIRELPEYELVAVCDISEERRESARRDLGCTTYEHLEEMLEKENGLDLICIVTRSDLHCEMACTCLDTGINTLVTKPWALNAAEAEKMINAWQRSGARLFPWIPSYWFPEYQKIKSLILEKIIGDVFTIRRYVTQFWRRSDWQTEQRFGGGYLLNWGAHIVQPMLDLADSPPKRVFGQLQQVINPGDADDNFLTIIEFENGIRGIAEFTQAVDGLPSFMVQGTHGMIRSDGNDISLLFKSPDSSKDPEISTFPVGEKLYGDERRIYRDIALDLRNQKSYPASPHSALQGTRVLDAIRESHQSSQLIDLNTKDYAMKF